MADYNREAPWRPVPSISVVYCTLLCEFVDPFRQRRDVDGSCAKYLTVESYMVIYAPNSYTCKLLLLVFHHPLSFQT